MKKYIFLFCLIITSITINSQAKKDKPDDYLEKVKTIDSTIETLYSVISGEKGKKRDWKLFKYLFKPEAKLIPTGKNNDGEFMVRYMTPDDYVKGSEKWLVENGFFEKEIHRKTEHFGSIAHVFSSYESYNNEADRNPLTRGTNPYTRGINSIQLLHDGQRWWIVNIYWTQETDQNPIPRKYLK
jgi:hypothetical protein